MVYVNRYLNPETIGFLDAKTKEEALEAMIDLLAESPNIEDKKAFHEAVFKREAVMSTGIGMGIAIPHVKIKEVSDICVAIGICKNGIEWDSMDGEPVKIIFLFAGSETQHELYLQTLSKIMLVLKNQKRREQMVAAQNVEEIIKLFENV